MRIKPSKWVAASSAAVKLSVALIVAVGAHGLAVAQNAQYQNYFFDVCGGTPTGALATRCAETPGNGDLSGDSEDSLNPAQALSVHQASLARARAVGREIQERLEGRRRADDDDDGRNVRWSIVAHSRWEDFERDATSLERALDGDLWGAQFGVDVRLSDRSFIGSLLSYDESDAEFGPDQPGVNFSPQANEGDTTTDGLSVMLFGSHQFTGKAWIDGYLGYGQTDLELVRNAVFQEAGRTVPQTDVQGISQADADELSGGVGVGVDGNRGALSGGVYGRLNYTQSKIDAFAESGSDSSGLQMQVSADDRESLRAVAGLQGSRAASTSWGVFVVHARLEYEHELDDDPLEVTASFLLDALDNPYRFAGDAPDEGTFNGGLGFTLVWPNGWSAFLDVEVLAGHDYLDRQRATLGLRKEL